MEEINIRIGKQRAKKGLTLRQAAEMLDINKETYKTYERSTSPKLETILKIADFYDVSVDYLLGRTDNETSDITLQQVCKYTGLSESAVQRLHDIKESVTALLSINQMDDKKMVEAIRDSFGSRYRFLNTVCFYEKEMMDALEKEYRGEASLDLFRELFDKSKDAEEKLWIGEATLDFINTIVSSSFFERIADCYSKMEISLDEDGNILPGPDDKDLGLQFKISLLLSKLFEESLPNKWLRILKLEEEFSPRLRYLIRNAITNYREQLDESNKLDFDKWLLDFGIQDKNQHKK